MTLSGPQWWLAFGSGVIVGAAVALGVVAAALRERHLRRLERRVPVAHRLRIVRDVGGDAA